MVQVADPFGSGTSGGGSLGQQLGFYGGTAQDQGVPIVDGPRGWSDPEPVPEYSSTASNLSLTSGGAFMLGMVILAMSGFRA